YAGGDFTSIGGAARQHLAALDGATGLATSWVADVTGPYYISSLNVNNGILYAGGDFSTIGGQSRKNLAAVDPSSATVLSWNPIADDPATGSVDALAASGSKVFSGGVLGLANNLPVGNVAAFEAPTPYQTPTATVTSTPSATQSTTPTGTASNTPTSSPTATRTATPSVS